MGMFKFFSPKKEKIPMGVTLFLEQTEYSPQESCYKLMAKIEGKEKPTWILDIFFEDSDLKIFIGKKPGEFFDKKIILKHRPECNDYLDLWFYEDSKSNDSD